jgi:sugar-specific transcriptional regulator TrmB
MKKTNGEKSKNEIEKLLELSGFSEKETAIYLALLELGKGTVSEVARKSGVGRTHCYLILGSLVSIELISVSGKEPKQEYIAESPLKLKEYLTEKFSKQKEIFEKMNQEIPTLVSMHNKGDRPKVRFYEGVAGLKTVYEDTLTSKENVIRGFLSYDELHKTLPNYFPDYFERRAKHGLFGKAIVTSTEKGEERSILNKKELRETVFVPKDKYYFIPEIDIYDNKVMIASWREKLGVIIESEEISDAMKKIFELALIGAKKIEEDKSKNSPV